MRKPDFERNMLRILRKENAERATLFELFLNPAYYRILAGHDAPEEGALGALRLETEAMAAAGFDYARTYGSEFHFRHQEREHLKTISLNGHSSITDWESFEKHPWMDPGKCDCSHLEKINPYLPEGMKLMLMGPGGVLENVIRLVGYDNLCIMLYDDPDLAKAIFDRVGSDLLRYYEISSGADSVGFICSNDDWGFNTQPMISPADMRKYVFPWHKKIVEAAHRAGKPCILHSCGNFSSVIDDVIDDMKYDGRHSYEDNIMPVEEAYELLHKRIVVMGGIDMNFLTLASPDEIYARSRAMLERTAGRGNYLLGSGNSIPEYIPFDHFMAMVRAATDTDR